MLQRAEFGSNTSWSSEDAGREAGLRSGRMVLQLNIWAEIWKGSALALASPHAPHMALD